LNFDVAGDHDSPKSIWEEEDDLDLSLTDQEDDTKYIGPFRESPEIKKQKSKLVSHKNNPIFLSPHHPELNASVEMSTTLWTTWKDHLAIQASVQKAALKWTSDLHTYTPHVT